MNSTVKKLEVKLAESELNATGYLQNILVAMR